MLQASFDGYFSAGELSVSEQWIIDSFLFNADQMSDGDVLKEDLIDLKENQAMKLLFDATKLQSFGVQTWKVTWNWVQKPCLF